MSFQIDDDIYYNTSDAFRGNRPNADTSYSYALAEVEELINSRLKSIVPDERKGDICFCLVLEALIDMTLHTSVILKPYHIGINLDPFIHFIRA